MKSFICQVQMEVGMEFFKTAQAEAINEIKISKMLRI